MKLILKQILLYTENIYPAPKASPGIQKRRVFTAIPMYPNGALQFYKFPNYEIKKL